MSQTKQKKTYQHVKGLKKVPHHSLHIRLLHHQLLLRPPIPNPHLHRIAHEATHVDTLAQHELGQDHDRCQESQIPSRLLANEAKVAPMVKERKIAHVDPPIVLEDLEAGDVALVAVEEVFRRLLQRSKERVDFIRRHGDLRLVVGALFSENLLAHLGAGDARKGAWFVGYVGWCAWGA
jgi:hypothetical protein